jgi:hypothetical protein
MRYERIGRVFESPRELHRRDARGGRGFGPCAGAEARGRTTPTCQQGSERPRRLDKIQQGVREPGRPRLPWKQQIGSSNPPTLTKFKQRESAPMTGFKIFGDHDENTKKQMARCMSVGSVRFQPLW